MYEEQAELANRLKPLRRRMLINRVLNGAGIGLICASFCEFVLGLTAFILNLEEIGWIGTGFSLAFGTAIMFRGIRIAPHGSMLRPLQTGYSAFLKRSLRHGGSRPLKV